MRKRTWLAMATAVASSLVLLVHPLPPRRSRLC